MARRACIVMGVFFMPVRSRSTGPVFRVSSYVRTLVRHVAMRISRNYLRVCTLYLVIVVSPNASRACKQNKTTSRKTGRKGRAIHTVTRTHNTHSKAPHLHPPPAPPPLVLISLLKQICIFSLEQSSRGNTFKLCSLPPPHPPTE